jgi:hypothetical protein
MAFLGGRMIWEFGYRRSKMEKIYHRIRTVYTIATLGVSKWGGTGKIGKMGAFLHTAVS